MKSKAVKILLGLSFYLLCVSDLHAQAWEFAKERSGIKVYTRKEEGTNLKSFLGVMDVHSNMEKVGDLLGNPLNHDWWDKNLREIKVLAYEKDKFNRYYLIYSVPWPLTDRDLCVEAKITIDPVTGTRVIYATPLFNVIPEKPDMVRIKRYWQKWTLEPKGNGIIHLELEGFVDPGGNVPSWLYNMVITETPLKVMREVQVRVR